MCEFIILDICESALNLVTTDDTATYECMTSNITSTDDISHEKLTSFSEVNSRLKQINKSTDFRGLNSETEVQYFQPSIRLAPIFQQKFDPSKKALIAQRKLIFWGSRPKEKDQTFARVKVKRKRKMSSNPEIEKDVSFRTNFWRGAGFMPLMKK